METWTLHAHRKDSMHVFKIELSTRIWTYCSNVIILTCCYKWQGISPTHNTVIHPWPLPWAHTPQVFLSFNNKDVYCQEKNIKSEQKLMFLNMFSLLSLFKFKKDIISIPTKWHEPCWEASLIISLLKFLTKPQWPLHQGMSLIKCTVHCSFWENLLPNLPLFNQDVLIILKVFFTYLKINVHQKIWNQIWNKYFHHMAI